MCPVARGATESHAQRLEQIRLLADEARRYVVHLDLHAQMVEVFDRAQDQRDKVIPHRIDGKKHADHVAWQSLPNWDGPAACSEKSKASLRWYDPDQVRWVGPDLMDLSAPPRTPACVVWLCRLGYTTQGARHTHSRCRAE